MKFQLKVQRSFWTPEVYVFIDPDTQKELFRIVERGSAEFFAELAGKRSYHVSVGLDDNPAQTNGLVIQKYSDRMFFAKSGKLELRSQQDVEALIVSLFFVERIRYIRSL